MVFAFCSYFFDRFVIAYTATMEETVKLTTFRRKLFIYSNNSLSVI